MIASLPSNEPQVIEAVTSESVVFQVKTTRSINLKSAMNSIEATLVIEALKKCEWSRTEAAKRLGLNRTTLVEKINRLVRDGFLKRS